MLRAIAMCVHVLCSEQWQMVVHSVGGSEQCCVLVAVAVNSVLVAVLLNSVVCWGQRESDGGSEAG